MKPTTEVGSWDVRDVQTLPNGLRVELVVGGNPLDAALAVCSTSTEGLPGPLNEMVLAALGFPPEQLPRLFRPPATVFWTEGKRPILVIQTVGRTDAIVGTVELSEQLVPHFRAGLEQLRARPLPRFDDGPPTMYLPLLGTGAGGLSHFESAKALLGALAEWRSPLVSRVALSAPTAEVAGEVAARWRSDAAKPVEDALLISVGKGGRHVQLALAVAQRLAANEGIAPSHVVRAIVGLKSLASSGFNAFRGLLELPPESHLASFLAELSASRLESSLRFAPDFDRQLRYCQETAGAPEIGRDLWGRELVAAALLAGGDDLPQLLSTTGRSLASLRDDWYRFVIAAEESVRTRDDWDQWWAFAGVTPPGKTSPDKESTRASSLPSPGPSRAGYFADTDQGEDRLGVEQEAEALARLILDENVEPPLSIGLLGDWGSGKSFFIELLKKQIVACKGGPGLHRDVIQIEFNAWHVSDGNLWASLVTHLFDEIWRQVVPVNASPEVERAIRARVTAEIGAAEGALHEASAEAANAQAAVAAAEQRRQRNLLELSLGKVVSAEAVKQLKARAKDVGWQRPLDNVVEAVAAARALGSAGERLRLQIGLAFGEAPRRFVVPLLVVLIVAGAAWWGVEKSGWESVTKALLLRTVQLAGGVGALLSALVIPMRSAKRLVDGFTEALAKTEQASRREGVEQARHELEAADASLAVARARLADLRNREASLDPAKRLGAFLEERVQSTQYRAQQGIISLVHRDFKRLSERMAEWRRERREARREVQSGTAVAAGGPGQITAQSLGQSVVPPKAVIEPFDRIVLYIDDLDRCRPEHVVSALEAVHLLLALDLFVVVVAVDSRWLIRALEVQYRDMLAPYGSREGAAARGSTSYDYLEKIFQITYALAPMDPVKFGAYVEALTGGVGNGETSSRVAPAAQEAHRPPAGPSSQDQPHPAPASDLAKRVATTDATHGAAEDAGSVGNLAPPTSSRRPEPRALPLLAFSVHERTVLGALVTLLPTPRIAKRLVNVYRLVKASQPSAVDTEAKQSAALFLLAVLFGRPIVGAELLRCLHERRSPFDGAGSRLLVAMAKHATAKRQSEPVNVKGELSRGATAADWDDLVTGGDSLELAAPLTVGDCAAAPAILARYSFVTGHEWHTWSRAVSSDAGVRS